MATLESVQELAIMFDKSEKALRTMKARFRRGRKLLADIASEGHLGGLEYEAMASRMDAFVTQADSDLWTMHHDFTEIAKARGIDLPTRDGGR